MPDYPSVMILALDECKGLPGLGEFNDVLADALAFQSIPELFAAADARTPALIVAPLKAIKALRMNPKLGAVPMLALAERERATVSDIASSSADDFLFTPFNGQEYVLRSARLRQGRKPEPTSERRRVDRKTGFLNTITNAAAIAATARAMAQGSGFSVFYIGLMGAETQLRQYGNPVEDAVITAIAGRIRQWCNSDQAQLLRHSESVFYVIEPRSAAAPAAQRLDVLKAQLGQPIDVAGLDIRPEIAMGWACSPEDGNVLDDVMTLAFRRAWSQTQPALTARQSARSSVPATDDKLARAIAAGDLKLHYQPITDLTTGRLMGIEALITWPKGDLAADLRAALTDYNAGFARGASLMPAVARRISADFSKGLPKGVQVHINASLAEIESSAVGDELRRAFSRGLISQHQVRLEIHAGPGLSSALPALHDLAAQGWTVVLDFGTNLAMASQLRGVPLGAMFKLRARSLDAPEASRLVGSLQADQTPVLASHIENARDLQLARTAGCLGGQGFYFSGPLPAEFALAGAQPQTEAQQV